MGRTAEPPPKLARAMRVAETWGFAARSLRSLGMPGCLHGDLHVDVKACNMCLRVARLSGMSNIKTHSPVSSMACVIYWDQEQVTSHPSTSPSCTEMLWGHIRLKQEPLGDVSWLTGVWMENEKDAPWGRRSDISSQTLSFGVRWREWGPDLSASMVALTPWRKDIYNTEVEHMWTWRGY